jgi:hypothetical protein
MPAGGQRYASPDASICEARASACVSTYSRIFVTLPFRSLLKQIRQSRVPAVRADQRPVLARNDPLNIFGRQRLQTLPIAAAHCCK